MTQKFFPEGERSGGAQKNEELSAANGEGGRAASENVRRHNGGLRHFLGTPVFRDARETSGNRKSDRIRGKFSHFSIFLFRFQSRKGEDVA